MWQTIKMHGFSVNSMYNANKHRSKRYNEWTDNMLKEMKQLKSLEELNIDPTQPMKIDIVFSTVRGFDIDNLIKSFLDVLVKHYKLEDDNNFTDIHLTRAYKFIDNINEGAIIFNISNCDGTILNKLDKIYLKLKRM
jgi:Holliday junction resolvase RusA-like endonuclease